MSQAAHTSPPGGPLSPPDRRLVLRSRYCCRALGLGVRTYVGVWGSAVEGPRIWAELSQYM